MEHLFILFGAVSYMSIFFKLKEGTSYFSERMGEKRQNANYFGS